MRIKNVAAQMYREMTALPHPQSFAVRLALADINSRQGWTMNDVAYYVRTGIWPAVGGINPAGC